MGIPNHSGRHSKLAFAIGLAALILSSGIVRHATARFLPTDKENGGVTFTDHHPARETPGNRRVAKRYRPVTLPPDDPIYTRPITDNADDRSLSPYFFVENGDPETDRLPLKATSADVDIAGVIADVTVTQVYENEGNTPLEAVYVFPGSTRAAVYAMTMTIGDRTIVAEIQERQKARQTYETAKRQGKSASLLEQQRPNVFQMNVANIMPGDTIQVEMRYTELLVPTDGIYEFVYPTVVGPRYSETPAAGAPAAGAPAAGAPDTEAWVENPYLTEGKAAPYDFDLGVSLSTGMPIMGIACPTHKTTIQYESSDFATVELDPNEYDGGNRDFILRYRLSGSKVESGLLLYEGEEENFFLLMAQPPRTVNVNMIPPREYIFVVDVSGSMRGFPLNISKGLLSELIGNLRPTDYFNVMLFSGGSKVMSKTSLAANEANIQRAITTIDKQHGGGGTRLLPALKRAMDLPRARGLSRTLVVVTDGYISVEPDVFDLIRNRLDDANVFAFGIGSSVNRHLIEGMARVGQGEPLVITKPAEAEEKASQFRQYIESPVLTDVQMELEGFDAYDIEPPSIPDVLAQRPVVVFGKYRGHAKGRIHLSGIGGDNIEYRASFDAGTIRPRSENSALRSLWARTRIRVLSDYNSIRANSKLQKEVTELGLEYNLLTQFTSFVAVDSKVRNRSGEMEHVKQPLPLPEGVSNSAVGGVPAQAQMLMGASSSSMGMGYGSGGGKARAKKAYRAPMPAMAPPTAKSEESVASPSASRRPAADSPALGSLGRSTSGVASGESDRRASSSHRESKGKVDLGDSSVSDDRESSKSRSDASGKSADRSSSSRDKDSATEDAKREASKLTVEVKADNASLQKSLLRHVRSIKACVAAVFEGNANAVGAIKVKLVVDGKGRVLQVTFVEVASALESSNLEGCLKSRIKRWRLPASPEGEKEMMFTITVGR